MKKTKKIRPNRSADQNKALIELIEAANAAFRSIKANHLRPEHQPTDFNLSRFLEALHIYPTRWKKDKSVRPRLDISFESTVGNIRAWLLKFRYQMNETDVNALKEIPFQRVSSILHNCSQSATDLYSRPYKRIEYHSLDPHDRDAIRKVRGKKLYEFLIISRPYEVETEFSSTVFTPPAEIAPAVIRWMHEVQEHALENDTLVFFEPLSSVTSHSIDGKTLSLKLQKTSYLMFAATNLNASCSELGTTYISRPDSWLCNSLNVIGVLFSKEGRGQRGYLVRRGPRVNDGPGTLAASFGGHVRWPQKPLTALIEILKKEWGIQAQDVYPHILAYGENLVQGERDILYAIETKLSAKAIQESFRKSSVGEETGRKLIPVTLSAKNYKNEIKKWDGDSWCQPSDRACWRLALKFMFKSRANPKSRVNP